MPNSAAAGWDDGPGRRRDGREEETGEAEPNKPEADLLTFDSACETEALQLRAPCASSAVVCLRWIRPAANQSGRRAGTRRLFRSGRGLDSLETERLARYCRGPSCCHSGAGSGRTSVFHCLICPALLQQPAVETSRSPGKPGLPARIY